MPKMGRRRSCRNCGRCVLGCSARRQMGQPASSWPSALDQRRPPVTTGAGSSEVVRREGPGDAACGRVAAGAQTVRRRRGRPGRRRPRARRPSWQDSGIPCEPRLFVDPGPLRGRAVDRRPPGPRAAHAVRRPERRLHHLALFRPPQLLLQPRLAAAGREHPAA
ncbi:MAG: hypothetical protein MZU84_06000 [Sphingobacterium sp.]|nr:hypothetical protein [Sphingobacterium sp.]